MRVNSPGSILDETVLTSSESDRVREDGAVADEAHMVDELASVRRTSVALLPVGGIRHTLQKRSCTLEHPSANA